jgi:hypothetical protein
MLSANVFVYLFRHRYPQMYCTYNYEYITHISCLPTLYHTFRRTPIYWSKGGKVNMAQGTRKPKSYGL